MCKFNNSTVRGIESDVRQLGAYNFVRTAGHISQSANAFGISAAELEANFGQTNYAL